MSDVGEGGGQHKEKGGKAKPKKSSTHIDMTPMVDLAFLLLTFFMLTTSFSKPKTMEIILPEKPKPDDKPIQIDDDRVLNLILAENDKIFYYVGIKNPEMRVTFYGVKGIRKVIMEKDKQLDSMIVLIKPTAKAKYRNVVDIFDEMNITNMKRYALVDINQKEEELIKNIPENPNQ